MLFTISTHVRRVLTSSPLQFLRRNNKNKGADPMKFRPLHDRVLIKRIDEQETVRGGIIIPDTAKEKPQEGEVMAVGTGKLLENGSVAALDVKAGDRILF